MAEMTKADVLKNIQDRIRNKKEKGSITKEDVALTLEEILGLIHICDCPYNSDNMRTIPFTFHSMGTLRTLPAVRQESGVDIPMYCYATQSGTYATEDEAFSCSIAEGERALIIYNGTEWQKQTLESLAQDIRQADKDTPASQYLAREIYSTLNSQLETLAGRIPTNYLTSESLEGYATSEDLNSLREDMQDDINEVLQARVLYSHEQLLGADGTNTVFKTSKKFVAGSTCVYLNGQRYFNGISYNEQKDNQTIKITDTLPEKDDIIVIEAIFLEDTETQTQETMEE